MGPILLIGRGRGYPPNSNICTNSAIHILLIFPYILPNFINFGLLHECLGIWGLSKTKCASPFSAFVPLMRYLLYEVFIGICPTVLSDEASACPSGFPGLLNQPPPVRHEHNTTHPFIICDARLIQYVNWSRFLNRQNEDGYQSRLILLLKCAVGSRVA